MATPGRGRGRGRAAVAVGLEGLCVTTGEVTLAEGTPWGWQLAVKGAPFVPARPGSAGWAQPCPVPPPGTELGRLQGPRARLAPLAPGQGAHGSPCGCVEEPFQHVSDSPSPGLQLEPALSLPSAPCQPCPASTRAGAPGERRRVPEFFPTFLPMALRVPRQAPLLSAAQHLFQMWPALPRSRRCCPAFYWQRGLQETRKARPCVR